MGEPDDELAKQKQRANERECASSLRKQLI